MKEVLKQVRDYLMSGVSYMIPAVVVGGIFIAAALATGSPGESGMEVTNPFMENILLLGVAGFTMMVPILGGYIAYGIAGKPALVPGMIAGYVANSPIGESEVTAGFLGAIILGLFAGFVVKWIKTWKVPNILRPVMPIFIIPIVSVSIVGLTYLYLLAQPMGMMMTSMTEGLLGMTDGSLVLLAIILGFMIAFDMGGPVNKVACLFAFGLMAEGVYTIMGIIAIAICTPPLGMGLATLLNKKKYSAQEKEAGKAALAMGTIGITEGAIPFAAADPLRVIPSIMIGSATGAVIGALAVVNNYAPHGGPIVLPVIDNRLWYVIAIVVGTTVTALLVNALKKEKSNDLSNEEAA
ncbi:PTS fructose transporter subunit IIC [Halalkalibacter alkaliphilus]|uniref:Fructose-specific PTS transporter subunit EIIC n=1 Tax=Halalkalibacter alkaliphilus TaxID=2917993 RepID=A0A9X2CQ97_9BACI|nr:fructose-specific PTS transporter subunit EIIC [Halalkalibacter alkaliphilus]MCL7745541.1 fructose-specific PTS transporter subunit EIIC [Halalkalibacter alkaliphilus]